MSELWTSVRNNDLQSVKSWISTGYDVNITHGYYKETPLMIACKQNNKEICKALLAVENIDVNVQDWNNNTALHLASSAGNKGVVELLINSGAILEGTDIYGYTPLHEAAENGMTEVVTFLIGCGSKINAVDNEGETPLSMAMLHGCARTVLSLLHEGAKITGIARKHLKGTKQEIQDLIKEWEESSGSNIVEIHEKFDNIDDIHEESRPDIGTVHEDHVESRPDIGIVHEDHVESRPDIGTVHEDHVETNHNIHVETDHGEGHSETFPKSVRSTKKYISSITQVDSLLPQSIDNFIESNVNVCHQISTKIDATNLTQPIESPGTSCNQSNLSGESNIVTFENFGVLADNEAPVITETIGNITVVENKPATLICGFTPNVDSNSTIHWFHNEEDITSKQGYLITSCEHTSILMIRNAKMLDSGKYKCAIKMSSGMTQCEGKLTVTDSDKQQISDELVRKLGGSYDKLKDYALHEIRQEIKSYLKVMDEKVETKMTDFKHSLITAIATSTMNVKTHIEENIRDLKSELQNNAKDEILKVAHQTAEQFDEMKKISEHNEFIYYKMFLTLSKVVGDQVGKWRLLAEHLLSNLPSAYLVELINMINNSHTNEKDKAYEVLLHWKVFSTETSVETLNKVIKQLELPDISMNVNQTVHVYARSKNRGHTGSLTEETLNNLAGNIGSEWFTIGLQLGLAKSRLEQLRESYSDIRSVITNMLIEWRNTTVGSVFDKHEVLKNALIKGDRRDLADELTV